MMGRTPDRDERRSRSMEANSLEQQNPAAEPAASASDPV
jgi:hypothetical protein